MRILLTTLATLLALVIGAAFVLPYALPQSWLRTTLTEALSDASGARVTIEGEVGWRVLPRLEARLEDVRVMDTPADLRLEDLHIARLDATVGLIDLLRGRLVVERFVLIEPDATLALAPAATAEPAEPAPSSPATPTPPAATPSPPDEDLPNVRLGEVRIERGRLVLRGAGEPRVLDGVDARLVWPEPTSTLAFELTGRLDGQPLTLDLQAATPLELMQSAGSRLDVEADLDGARLDFAGTAALGGSPRAEGRLGVHITDMVGSLARLGTDAANLPFGSFEGSANLTAAPERVELAGLDAALDEARVAGDLALTLSDARPRLTGRLDVGEVDLTTAASGPTPSAPAPSPTASENTGPAEPGAESAAPAPVAAPTVPLDLDVELALAGLRAPPFEVGASRLHLGGRDGGLVVDLVEVLAYDGSVQGQVAYTPRGEGLELSSTLEGSGVDAAALLDALGIDEVGGGRLAFAVDLTSGGRTRQDLLAVDGTGRIEGSDLALRRLGEAAEAAALADLLLLGQSGGSVTVADLTASFSAQDGILRNDDLVAGTGALRLTGSGTIDLPAQRVRRYVVTPEPLLDLERLGSLQLLRSVMLPVVIEGPFDDLRVRPDPAALEDRAASELRRALERLGGAGEQSESGGEENPAATIEQGVRDILRGFGIRP